MKIKKIIEPFLLLSKAERNGALILLTIIGVLLLIRIFIPVFYSPDERKKFEFENRIAQYENEDGKTTKEAVVKKRTDQKYSTRSKSSGVGGEKAERSIVPKELFNFNPNQVSFEELIRLGFTQLAANNLINYRSKGGKFNKPDDIKKIYGVDSSFYLSISLFISIPKSSEFSFVKLDLNSADSTAMTALKGIGPVLASRICKYRNQLGGFVSSEQLKEVYQLPQETYNQLLDYVWIDSSNVKKININFASIDDLKRHPYCKYANARKIVDYRSANGNIQSLESLVTDSVIDSTTFKRLSPYLKIE